MGGVKSLSFQVYTLLNSSLIKDDGIVTQVSYGFIKPSIDNFTFISHQTLVTLDGHYAIVYLVLNSNKYVSNLYLSLNATESIKYSIYVHFINDDQDQISEEHLLFQDSTDNAITDVSLTECNSGFDTFNIQSNGCTFDYFLISDSPITLKTATSFITFSSSGAVIQRDVISSIDLLETLTATIQHISVIPLPYGGFFSINYIMLDDTYSYQLQTI
ncbi:15657_t:CDS:2 [Dentiscutata heterogama]|uniref:15657_t:CDS:1 n=1 Tax=Dentiscutata heterogama TaxID=1316150 RepID=A0ACA9KW62_9GLOM|nr:15657_t:CDS:2 [Dentiscutata heterogama]